MRQSRFQSVPELPVPTSRYVLCEEFASGGMGKVHLGRLVGPEGFCRVVAIKRISSSFARDPEFRAMLLDEGRLAARIRHPNVVPALDIVSSDDGLFLVMEYVHGLAASRVLALARGRRERIPVHIAAAIGRDALQGLHAAHEARDENGQPLGIVHRDVSPQNILVGADGLARLVDFGIAKAVVRSQVTGPGVLKGKISYMAPEQLEHKPATRQSDIYSSAIVLWELLVGNPLFERSEAAVRARVLGEVEVSPPSAFASGIPAGLDAVVLRGLSAEARERFPTARAMALALEECTPIASSLEVAAWLERFAADDLELSTERVSRVEAKAIAAPGALGERSEIVRIDPDATRTEAPRPKPRAEPDAPTTDERTGGLRASRSWAFAALGVFSLAAFAGLAVVLASKTAAPTRAPPPVPVATKESATTDTGAALTARPAPSTSGAVSSFPSGTASGPVHPLPSSFRPAQPAKVSNKCNPPYTFDASGRKLFKSECF